jgi:hypothetical protein
MRAVVLLLLACGAGCLDRFVGEDGRDPDAPDGGIGGSGDLAAPPTIEGASAKYPDFATLWQSPIYRTCGPNNGVCHQNKQFPHMELATSLVGAINDRCNQLRDDPLTIDNLCEPPGDWLAIGAWKSRIAFVNEVPALMPTSVEITLADPIPAGTTGAIAVVRQRPGLQEAQFPIPGEMLLSTSGKTIAFDWSKISNKYAAPGPGGRSMAEFLAPLRYLVQGDETQVELGDPNADGVFGAMLGGAEIKPGDPLKSYLFLRVIGPLAHDGNVLTNVAVQAAPEPQMPIANFQYWDLDNAVVALWCWISGLQPDGKNALDPIDYAGCDLSAMPAPQHQGGEASTYSALYEQVLRPSCSGCHNAAAPVGGTSFFIEDSVKTYATLLGISGSGPSESGGMPYVTKNAPAQSFLLLKLKGDPSAGTRMPPTGMLPQSTIDAVETWIAQGANQN